jgi:hypothetical protein
MTGGLPWWVWAAYAVFFAIWTWLVPVLESQNCRQAQDTAVSDEEWRKFIDTHRLTLVNLSG